MENLNISSVKWIRDPITRENSTTTIILVETNGQESIIPTDPSNSYYAEILRQVDAGELTIEDAD